MASTPLTLAALATSAVAQLEVTGARAHTSGSNGAFVSAVLETDRGEVIVRVPATPAAEVQQSGELLGLGALTEGARGTLPFLAPTTLGITRAGDTRAVASTFLSGLQLTLADLEEQPRLLQSTAEAIAAIHSLPTAVIRDGGLAMRDASEVRSLASRLVQRADDTGLLPSTVDKRWREALGADSLWSFEPTVVHGSLDIEQLLFEGDRISGVLGWSELSLGDPAADLTWLFEGPTELAEAALAHYSNKRDISGTQELRSRAKFYHELEVAKWLLHGVDSRDQSIIDDGVQMLDRMVDHLGLLGSPAPQRPVLSEQEVERLLDKTPLIEVDLRSETAEYDALDEDRVFSADSDFDEHDESTDSPEPTETQFARPESSADHDSDDARS